jgi:SAM-dependent methyltransferase
VNRGDLELWRCPACRFVSGYPAQAQPADQHYADYYARAEPPSPVARYTEWLDAIEGKLGGRGRLLEVGAGRGAFARLALSRGWDVDVTEVSTSGLEHLQQTGVRVFAGGLADAAYPPGAFDVVVSLEVLEHVPTPAAELAEIARVTRAGGLLLLTTPNLRGLTGRVFKAKWRVVHTEHLGYFTPSTLRQAIRTAGFREAEVKTRSLDITSWRPVRGDAMVAFDPEASARLRDRVQASAWSRAAREAAHTVLGLTGLGDTLMAWARR